VSCSGWHWQAHCPLEAPSKMSKQGLDQMQPSLVHKHAQQEIA